MGSAGHSAELSNLLRTKLQRPPITADLVPRPCLLERLGRRSWATATNFDGRAC